MNHCQFIKHDDEINFVYRHDEFRIVIRSVSHAFESIVARISVNDASRCFHAKAKETIENKVVDMQHSVSVETTICTPEDYTLHLKFQGQTKTIVLSEAEWMQVLNYMRAEHVA